MPKPTATTATPNRIRVTYRPAIAADRLWLFELKRATMRDYVAAIYGWEDNAQRRLFEEKFDPTRLQIIRADGHDAGLLETHEKAEGIYLAQVEIAPDFQKQGIGSTVIQSILDRATRQKKRVSLQVLRSNPARLLYERLGFKVHAETKTHFLMMHGGPAILDRGA